MAGLHLQLDVEYQNDPKIIRAGALSELLFVRSMAMAKRMMEDGRIDAAHLPGLALGIPGRPAKHAEALVREGLWELVPGGWRIASWTKRNPSRAEIEAARQIAKESGARGNHERWHVGPDGKPSAKCPLCIAARSGAPTPTESGHGRGRIAKSEGEGEGEGEGKPEGEGKGEASSSPEGLTGPIAPPAARPPDDDDDGTILVSTALELLADRAIARTTAAGNRITNALGYRRKVLAEVRHEHTARLHRLRAEHPDWMSDQLADAIDPPAPPVAQADPLAEARRRGVRAAELEDIDAQGAADGLANDDQRAAFWAARQQALGGAA